MKDAIEEEEVVVEVEVEVEVMDWVIWEQKKRMKSRHVVSYAFIRVIKSQLLYTIRGTLFGSPWPPVFYFILLLLYLLFFFLKKSTSVVLL